jgi:hypothetical protein
MTCGLFISPGVKNVDDFDKKKNYPLSSHVDLNKYFGK